MNKREFLDSLRAALATRVSASETAENVSYYEDYINTQRRMGKSEEEVIRSLGDPRLLARSIAEASKHAGAGWTQDGAYRSADRESSYTKEQDYHSYTDGQDYQGYAGERDYGGRTPRMPGWLIVFLAVFVIILILSAVFSVLSFLAPILLPVLLIMLVVKLVRRS